MKSKLLFLLPRLAALTLMIGAALIVLSLLFKVLLGVTILGVIGFGLVAIVKKIRNHHLNKDDIAGLPKQYASQWAQPAASAVRSTIVPIN